MSKRMVVMRGLAVMALVGLVAGAMATSSGAAAPVTKSKVKKISTKTSNNVFNQNIPNYAGRVSSTLVESPVDPANDPSATTSITAPAGGYVVVHGLAGLSNPSGNDTGSCFVDMNGNTINGAEYPWTLDPVESEENTCVSHTVVTVTAGTYNFEFFVDGLAGTSSVSDARVTAQYVPLGATGARP